MRDFEPARRPPSRTPSPTGWIIALLGLLLLVGSYQLLPGDLGGALPAGLRTVAWLGIVLGILLALLQRRQRRTPPGARIDPVHDEDADEYDQAGVTRPSVLAALGIARAPSVSEPAFVDTIAVPTTASEVDEDPSMPPREDAPRPAPAGPPPVRWSPLLLQRLDAEQFLALCRSFFSQAGFATSVANGSDKHEGADLWVQSRHMPEPRIVRCRHWHDAPVDAREMREFLRSMGANNLAHGTYVTSATFTAEASDFAKTHGIQVQDGPALLRLISHRTAEQQRELMSAALGPGRELPTTTIAGAL
ncbi:restriction endonuclease [Variovorax dokdonensis]|uniref:Restriction endonuclease n=1 Tax=Variovorax dokdonensis TaxID=344883 RepID=A0ABT7NEX7_9BURK|nr:restriction endonuclease [Variovorax dokdonensis]MDM0046496.1 restriction endonuclease [Variovorax dokdonensis]